MIFESHETVKWNRTSWIYFAWIEMANVWPTGLFLVFPPFPRLFCLASPESCYVFGQLPSYLLLHSNCHRRPRIGQPLLSLPRTSREKTLQHPSRWTQSPHSVFIFKSLTQQFKLYQCLSVSSVPVSLLSFAPFSLPAKSTSFFSHSWLTDTGFSNCDAISEQQIVILILLVTDKINQLTVTGTRWCVNGQQINQSIKSISFLVPYILFSMTCILILLVSDALNFAGRVYCMMVAYDSDICSKEVYLYSHAPIYC